MYEPTYWKDEVVENPYRYKETQNSDGSIEHVPDPGEWKCVGVVRRHETG